MFCFVLLLCFLFDWLFTVCICLLVWLGLVWNDGFFLFVYCSILFCFVLFCAVLCCAVCLFVCLVVLSCFVSFGLIWFDGFVLVCVFDWFVSLGLAWLYMLLCFLFLFVGLVGCFFFLFVCLAWFGLG